MLFKCCTQYVSKFGKFHCGSGLEKVSFHSNPKERQAKKVKTNKQKKMYVPRWY